MSNEPTKPNDKQVALSQLLAWLLRTFPGLQNLWPLFLIIGTIIFYYLEGSK